MSLSFLHVGAWFRIFSFLRLNNISCMCLVLFIHSSVGGLLGYSHFLVIVSNTAINLGVCLFKSLLPLLLGIHPKVELLDQMIILCLIFLRNCHTMFYGTFPSATYKGSSFSTSLPHANACFLLLLFFIVTILIGVR